MDEIRIHPHALKHGVAQEEIIYAWRNFARKRPRGDDCWVTIGFTNIGHEVEMIGMVLADGTTLIIHAISPATERIKRELGRARWKKMEYTLKSGRVITDAEIEAMAVAAESGALPGQWSGGVVVGRPRLADEPLDVISFKVPHSTALAIKRAAEQEGESRSAFLRKAALDRVENVLAAS